MKELKQQDKLSEKQQIESIVKKKIEIEYKLVGNLRPLRGHTLWEIDLETLDIVKAQIVTNKTITWEDALKMFDGTLVEDVQIKPGKVYISALNQKNALKRYHEKKGSAIRPEAMFNISDLFW